MVVLPHDRLSGGFSRGRHACVAKSNIYGRVRCSSDGPLARVLLFAITQVTRLVKKKRKEKREREKERRGQRRGRGGRRRKRRRRRGRRRRGRGKEEDTDETAPSLERTGPFLSQSDLFRLVAASMRGHSNLAIFARANLKKHERLTRAKMLLITRGRITCRKTKTRASATHR